MRNSASLGPYTRTLPRAIHVCMASQAQPLLSHVRKRAVLYPVSDDEPEDDREYLDLAKFPVPAELSSDEEGGGEEGGKEGSEEGGEEESEDSEEDDVPLAQRKKKVARV